MEPAIGAIAAPPTAVDDGPRRELREKIEGLFTPADRARIERAYVFSVRAHGDQRRKSGEPYIVHPVAVAVILGDLRMDADVLIAALLHDVAEDTTTTLADLKKEFGAPIAALVDGVTKLRAAEERLGESGQRGGSRDEVAAESVRKMFLAMADDIRVVLIRLADRLHNMRTLDFLAPASRRRIAQETMDIFAPLASRLGIWQIKWELEDLAFRHLEPETYRDIARRLQSRRAQRERYIAQVSSQLKQVLAQAHIAAEVAGRPKHIYSIWRKMQVRGVEFANIYDLLAIRIIVETDLDCYHALGIVHQLWRPIAGQFDDYIANPKHSMYQSLHTTVFGPEGRPLEVQIRTRDMHVSAEYGIAAHWRYKEGAKGRDVKYEQKIAWLRQLLDWQSDVVGGAEEFVESLKADVFRDQVYVFTPRGEIRELPAGSTPLDFAYRIHTDIGHRCTGARVNNRLVGLDTPLHNGDIVEIQTSKTPKAPSRDWLNPHLNYVRTAHAREKIRQWFRRQQREENLARGREFLEKELARVGLSKTSHEDLAALFKFERLDDFLVAIGCGELSPQSIAMRLLGDQQPAPATIVTPRPTRAPSPGGVTVAGVGDLLTRLAPCCAPVPNEPIVGYVTRGTGVTVHRDNCPNIAHKDERARLIAVQWGQTRSLYPIKIRVEAWDRDGLMRDVAAVVADERINMSSVLSQSHPDRTCTITATLEIADIQAFGRILARLEGIRGVLSVNRETI